MKDGKISKVLPMRHRCISVQGFVFTVTHSTFFFIVRRYISCFNFARQPERFCRLNVNLSDDIDQCRVLLKKKKKKKITLSRGNSKRPAWKVIVIVQQPCPNLVQMLRLNVTQAGAVKLMIVFITTCDQRVDVNKTFVRDCSTFG